jgi:hypothetical protein
MTAFMKPNWLPNWLDESQYPDPVNATPVQWAWEFLRRNRKYQRVWHELVEPNYNPTIAGGQRRHPGRRTRLRVEPDDLRPFLREFYIVSRPPPSPAESNAMPEFEIERIGYVESSKRRGRVQGYLEPGQMVVWLDLRWPIQPQLRNAKAAFEEVQKQQGISNRGSRARANKYKTYLRILDAVEHGAPLKQIGAIIYPRLGGSYPNNVATQRARDDLKAAKRLRDRDFWRIALSKN